MANQVTRTLTFTATVISVAEWNIYRSAISFKTRIANTDLVQISDSDTTANTNYVGLEAGMSSNYNIRNNDDPTRQFWGRSKSGSQTVDIVETIIDTPLQPSPKFPVGLVY